MQIYTLEYESEIEYPKGLNTECISEKGHLNSWSCIRAKTAKIGEKITKTDKISFTRTENGWRGPDKNIY
jgi:hypothetical protein